MRFALPGVSDPTIRLTLERLKKDGLVNPDGPGRSAVWVKQRQADRQSSSRGRYRAGMSEIVLMGDPRVAAIPVSSIDDPLIDFRDAFRTSSLKDEDNAAPFYLRSDLVTRLFAAQDHLPDGYEFLMVEGFRPLELQEHYFSSYRDELQEMDGSLSAEESFQLASRYVAPPLIAPHVSGAAIDLTLVDPEGAECDMGAAINATPEESKGGCYFGATNISNEARYHRALLARALGEVGLVNYPTEWWHWSYGDRYWALITGRPSALYGPLSQVEGEFR